MASLRILVPLIFAVLAALGLSRAIVRLDEKQAESNRIERELARLGPAAEAGNRKAEKTAARLAQLKSSLARDSRPEPSVRGIPGMAGGGSEIRAALARAGIFASSCRLSGTGKDEAMEFSVEAGAVPFLRFLGDAASSLGPRAVVFLSLRNDPDSGKLSATFRTRAEADSAEAIASPAASPDPATLARVFSRPRPTAVAAKASRAPRPQLAERKREPSAASWLRALGSLEESSGLRWLFFKDERRDRVLRLRGDGAVAEDGAAPRFPARLVSDETERYVLEIDGEMVAVGKAPR
ncbi:MAG TPA: hypothetical protein VMV90_16070 [Rectinemataceae bacterium]|nr:hypothetical protein [Rectinemataceae bacterium]